MFNHKLIEVMRSCEEILVLYSYMAQMNGCLSEAEVDVITIAAKLWNEIATTLLGYDVLVDADIDNMVNSPTSIPETLARLSNQFNQENTICNG